MKTAISIPENVYADAQRLARKLKKSRSQLYSEAIAEYIARHDDDEVTEAMNRVCDASDPEDIAWSAAGIFPSQEDQVPVFDDLSWWCRAMHSTEVASPPPFAFR